MPNGVGAMNDGSQVRSVVRQRLVDDLQPLAPLTILCGIPGTAKSTLVAQMHAQGVRGPEEESKGVLVGFPRRRLGGKAALAFAVEASTAQLGLDPPQREQLLAIRRGRFDVDDVTQRIARWFEAAGPFTLCILNYEWQASPELDELIVSTVASGVDVVCTLIDPEPLQSRAQGQGIAVRVVEDSELCFKHPELARLAQFYGVEPTPEVLSRVEELTAGHPMISSVAMLELAGIEKVTVGQGEVTLIGRDFGTRRAAMSDLGQLAYGPRPALKRVDPSNISVDDLGKAVAVLRLQEPVVDELRLSDQGRSPFVRFVSGLLTVPWADLSALEAAWPGSSSYVHRLNAAGYTRIEFDGVGPGRLVWTEGVRAVASEWLHVAGWAVGDDNKLSDLCSNVVEWYAANRRFDEAVELTGQTGDAAVIEHLAVTHFIDFVTDGRSHGFGAHLPRTEAEARQFPVTAILAALESHPLARDDWGVAQRVLVAVREQESSCGCGEPESSLRACLVALVGLSVLDRWDEGAELSGHALDALESLLAVSPSSGEELARAYLLLGIVTLVRAQIGDARASLSRAVALSQREGPVFRTAVVGLRALEGYFGELLFDPAVDRDRIMQEYLGPSEKGLAWQESLVFLVLSRVWSSLWQGHYETALEDASRLVRQVPLCSIQPMVVWTHGLVLLLNGRPEQAYALYRDVEQRTQSAGLPPRSSSIFVLGFTLACLAEGRLREATTVAARRGQANDTLDRMMRLALGYTSGRDKVLPLPEEQKRPGPLPTVRARTLFAFIRMISLIRGGRETEAREILQQVVTTATACDADFVCRFMSKQANAEISSLVATVVPSEVGDAIMRAVDGPHILREGLADVHLSKAQLQVLRLLAQGMRNQEIADSLYLSVNTVKTHLREINRKLGTSDRFEAIALARRFGFINS